MPKIPKFISEARITEQAASVKSNVQIPLSQTIGTALAPVTKAVVEHGIKEKNLENKSETLKLENQSIMELNDVIERASRLNNKDQAYNLIQTESKSIGEKYANQASNNFVKNSFNANFLGEVQKGIFKTNTRVSKNILDTLDNEVSIKQNRLLTQAYVSKDPMALRLITTDLEKLYEDSYKGRIDVDEYDKLIQSIPGVIEGFEVTQEISSNPKQAYLNLMDKNKYTNITLDKRIKFINEVETIITPELKKEFNNVIFSLQDKGTEQSFDFNFAKQILKPQEYNDLRTNYDLAKTNAEDVRLINTLPLSEVNNVLESKNFNTDLYVGSADRITQAKLQQGLIKAIANRTKQMKSDPVKFITETNPEIAELTNNYQNETNESVKLKNRELLSNALIDVQTKMEVSPSNIKILTKAEVTSIKSTLTNPDTPWEEKQSFINSLPAIYGTDNMGKVLNHLQFEKLPNEYAVAMSTNNKDLSRDILIGSSTKDLEKVVAARLTGSMTPSLVLKYVGTAMKDSGYEDVIYNQGSGSVDKTVFIGSIQDTLYNATLERINKGVEPKEAAKSAVSDFISDYKIDPSLTYMIPTDINGKTVNQGFVTVVNDNILLGIQDTAEGNYLDRFHGEDGYIHYAQFSNAEGVTEEMAKEKITSTIRNNAKWLLNANGTGAILYAEFSDGTYPITNAKGQKIETSFLNPTSTYPVTGDELPLIDYVDPYGAVEYEEVVND